MWILLLCLRLTNIDCCFLFVPGQDPDLNVSFHQGLYGLWNLILELVLDCCGSQQLQVLHQEKKMSARGDYNRGRALKRHVSEKHVSRDCVTHSAMFFSTSVAVVYQSQKPPQVMESADAISLKPIFTPAHPQNSIGFSQETQWF